MDTTEFDAIVELAGDIPVLPADPGDAVAVYRDEVVDRILDRVKDHQRLDLGEVIMLLFDAADDLTGGDDGEQ